MTYRPRGERAWISPGFPSSKIETVSRENNNVRFWIGKGNLPLGPCALAAGALLLIAATDVAYSRLSLRDLISLH